MSFPIHRPRRLRQHPALREGTAFGTPCPLETKLASTLQDRVPGLDRVRLVNSGTEATMSALRLSRGFTGRSRALKFAGCYHGHADSFLIQAGSGAAALEIPNSPGVPEELAGLTLTAPFNDLEAVERLLDRWGSEVAAVIVEPVPGNMGVVPPAEGFLEGLLELARKHGALLIFDEVMTGFRVDPGGAARLFGVQPDLYCLGKIIGGGMPAGAFGGQADVIRTWLRKAPFIMPELSLATPWPWRPDWPRCKNCQTQQFIGTWSKKAPGLRHSHKMLPPATTYPCR